MRSILILILANFIVVSCANYQKHEEKSKKHPSQFHYSTIKTVVTDIRFHNGRGYIYDVQEAVETKQSLPDNSTQHDQMGQQ